ncbi:MAG: glycosyltransferase [Kiritimatiellae bacterium]|nr:glycosyltransferase [Kiritimatiellia bacterium]
MDTNARECAARCGIECLSIVMPCYKLAGRAGRNVLEVRDYMRTLGVPFEVVPVDDGSGDGTAEELRAVAGDGVKPVLLAQNGGKGNALREGVAASRGSYILLLDGDLDLAPEMLPRFFEAMEKNRADIVVGSKRHPESVVDYPWHRRVASAVYFAFVRMLAGVEVSDTQAGMKLFRRSVLERTLAKMLVKKYAFDLELLAIACEDGAKIAEAPVELRFKGTFGCLAPRTVFDMTKDTLAIFYRLRILHYYRHAAVPPPLAKKPFFTVVIACPKPSDWLRECLDALAGQTFKDFEVIVLPDFECEIDAAANVRVIPTGKVRPAEKRNTGIAEAKGNVVAFIDDDAYPAPDWLARASIYFGDETIGGVGGPGITPPGDSYLAKIGGRVYENPFVGGAYRYRYVAGTIRRDVDDYPSCNLFVRTEILRAINGYRTDFWPGEDTLLCEDIVYKQGKRIVYDPWTIVYHHRRKIFMPHLRQLTRYALHRGYFAKRHPKTSFKLAYFLPSALFLYAIFAAGIWFAPVPFAVAAACSAPMAVYFILIAATSFSLNPATWLLTVVAIFASHAGYGARFLAGLCSRRMPCEYIGKDHACK